MWTKWKKTLLAVALHLLGLRHHLLLLNLIVHQVFYMGDASYAKLFGKELAEVFSFQSQPPILHYPTPECTRGRYILCKIYDKIGRDFHSLGLSTHHKLTFLHVLAISHWEAKNLT